MQLSRSGLSLWPGQKRCPSIVSLWRNSLMLIRRLCAFHPPISRVMASRLQLDARMVALWSGYVMMTEVSTVQLLNFPSMFLNNYDSAKVSLPVRRGSGSCSALKWVTSDEGTFLFTSFSTGKLMSYILEERGSGEKGTMTFRGAVSVGVAVNCLEYAEGVLLAGCSDGGLRLLPLLEGARFGKAPTLWNAVNGKNSRGLTSISCSFSHGTPKRLICATGAADGSVALFELKKARY
mmetsp:Transcript_24111/g.56237  ORF Transcript_24111/g.56237 Transcript_24111/m.56237 type:complete len:236 (+) Transcript_24111:743-1450(+)